MVVLQKRGLVVRFGVKQSKFLDALKATFFSIILAAEHARNGRPARLCVWLLGPRVTQKLLVAAMAESTENGDGWLARIENGVQANLGDRWRAARWTDFLKEVVWWLHEEEARDDEDIVETAAALVRYGIRNAQDLGNVANTQRDFSESLVRYGVLAAICDCLFIKYVARDTGVEQLDDHFIPVMLSHVVNSMKSGWEKISSERTSSESSAARNYSVSWYGLRNEETCQILGDNTMNVINAHIWPHNNKHCLNLVGLQPSDIDDPRNLLRLHEDIEYHFDRFHLTLVPSGQDFVLKVLDSSILTTVLKDRTEIFADIDGRKLKCPSGSIPWRRLLATHSILAHQKAREEGWLSQDQLTAAESSAQELVDFSLDSEAQERVKRFLRDQRNQGNNNATAG